MCDVVTHVDDDEDDNESGINGDVVSSIDSILIS